MPLGAEKAGLLGSAGAGGGARGILGGGSSDPLGATNSITYITIPTTSDTTDFGDLLGTMYQGGCASNGSSDRGLFMAGQWPTLNNNTIEYITISTPGNATDFGDALIKSSVMYNQSGVSNNTNDRMVNAGGYCNPCTPNAQQSMMNYVTISSTGDATDFGDLSIRRNAFGITSNGTNERGIAYYGSVPFTPCAAQWNSIDYWTINSPGNSTDFGDGTSKGSENASFSNLTNERGISAGLFLDCTTPPFVYGGSDVIDYITINSTGNATDFGNCVTGSSSVRGCSDGTAERGVFGGGMTGSGSPQTQTNILQYITINSAGDATDFGDTATKIKIGGMCSDAD